MSMGMFKMNPSPQMKLLLTMGGGYSSNVYTGTVDDVECALKIFKQHITQEAIRQEVEIMSLMQHRSLVQVVCVDQRPRPRWVALELCESFDLFDLVQRTGPFESRVARHMLGELLAGIDYLHSRNLAHRDIKLQNILFAKQHFQPKLTDFGFVCPADNNLVPRHVGTPGYMSLELMHRDKHVRADHLPKSDMFALGVVLFNLLFGKMPFGTSLLSNAFKVMRLADSDWQWDVNEDEDVQELLEGLFNPNLEERWDTEDLQQCAWMNQDTCTQEEYIAEIQRRKALIKQTY